MCVNKKIHGETIAIYVVASSFNQISFEIHMISSNELNMEVITRIGRITKRSFLLTFPKAKDEIHETDVQLFCCFLFYHQILACSHACLLSGGELVAKYACQTMASWYAKPVETIHVACLGQLNQSCPAQRALQRTLCCRSCLQAATTKGYVMKENSCLSFPGVECLDRMDIVRSKLADMSQIRRKYTIICYTSTRCDSSFRHEGCFSNVQP